MKKIQLFALAIIGFYACLNLSSCKNDEEDTLFKYNETMNAPRIEWITPNSVNANPLGPNGFVLLTNERSLLQTPQNLEKAYDMIGYSENGIIIRSADYTDFYNQYGCFFYGLEPNTTYYCIGIVPDFGGNVNHCYWYSDIVSFTTHPEIPEIVDLGLSVKWRGLNLDSANPYDCGNGYMWGSIKPGYNKNPTYPEDLDIIGTQYDAATQILGSNWRMPSIEECKELANNCSCQQVICYNKETEQPSWGVYMTGPNGNHLFIPCSWGLIKYNTDDPNNIRYYLDFDTCNIWIGEKTDYSRYFFRAGYDGYPKHEATVSSTDVNWELPIRAVMD